MEYKYYIGADISKHTIDFTILKQGEFFLHEKIPNQSRQITLWFKQMMTSYKAGGKRTLFCVENSGIYTSHLVKLLASKKIPLWFESALRIKLTLGLQRGKNDKLDSIRIAEYAYTFRNKCNLWSEPREVIEHLKKLRSLRERLLVARQQLSTEERELTQYIQKSVSTSITEHCKASLTSLAQDIKQVDATIHNLITGDQRLFSLYNWITSVQGVGKVLATEMLIATNEFKNFNNPKKFACHCGIAPFKYTSGISLESKARVSKRANKRMKRLLHMAAMSAIRNAGDYKKYFERRVEQSVNKSSVLNVVRNKIVKRVFACVRDERCYNEKYIPKYQIGG